MKASEFDRKFDAGEDCRATSTGRRRGVPILRRGASTSTFPLGRRSAGPRSPPPRRHPAGAGQTLDRRAARPRRVSGRVPSRSATTPRPGISVPGRSTSTTMPRSRPGAGVFTLGPAAGKDEWRRRQANAAPTAHYANSEDFVMFWFPNLVLLSHNPILQIRRV